MTTNFNKIIIIIMINYKTIILTLSLLSILSPTSYGYVPKEWGTESIVLGGSFNEGWKVGWKAGWKQVNGQYSYPSYPPFPPFPNFDENNFQGGYNAGFLAGMQAAGG